MYQNTFDSRALPGPDGNLLCYHALTELNELSTTVPQNSAGFMEVGAREGEGEKKGRKGFAPDF